jgi:hypothetical protein
MLFVKQRDKRRNINKERGSSSHFPSAIPIEIISLAASQIWTRPKMKGRVTKSDRIPDSPR